MKILHVALGNQFDIRDALKRYGEVIYWDWSGKDKSFNDDIRALAKLHKPDLIWLQIQSPNIISPSLAHELAKESVVINWTGDVRHPLPTWYMQVGQYIHMTLFTNMVDVMEMRKYKVRADYLQIGFPDKIFTPKGTARNEAEIVFMGNNTGGFPLSNYRAQMVEALTKRYGKRFKCYGNNWKGYGIEPNQIEEAKIYRGAKIGINLSHFNYDRYSSDRLFRLMGAGPLCLSHDYNGIEKEFKKGVHLDTWNTIEGLCERIDHYLNNEPERKKIAQAGCKHVHDNCTWKNRIADLEKLIIKSND